MRLNPLPTLPEDLAAATPLEVDTLLEGLYLEHQRRTSSLGYLADSMRSQNGERRQQISRNRYTYAKPLAETIAALEGRLDERRRGQLGTVADLLAEYRQGVEAVREVEALESILNAEYQRRPWSRFFTVQSHNGHIHSSMNCQTCNRNGSSTSFAWNVQLSGKTEEEAVALLGPTLCTVCFPTAPVAWTLGKPDTSCTGAIVEGTRRALGGSLRGQTWYGDCECGKTGVRVKDDGRPFKHQPVNPPAPAAAEPTVDSALAEVEQAGETLDAIAAAAAAAGVDLVAAGPAPMTAQPEQQHQGADDQAAPLVAEIGPFDEIEHDGEPGTVYVVDSVTPAGRVMARVAGQLAMQVRFLAAKCRVVRTAEQVSAAMTRDERVAELSSVARYAARTGRTADLNRLRALVTLRYGLTFDNGHVKAADGYLITQGVKSLAVLLEQDRATLLRIVRESMPAAPAGDVTDQAPARNTWAGHGRPAAGLWHGTQVEPWAVGIPATFEAEGDGARVTFVRGGDSLELADEDVFWLVPADTVEGVTVDLTNTMPAAWASGQPAVTPAFSGAIAPAPAAAPAGGCPFRAGARFATWRGQGYAAEGIFYGTSTDLPSRHGRMAELTGPESHTVRLTFTDDGSTRDLSDSARFWLIRTDGDRAPAARAAYVGPVHFRLDPLAAVRCGEPFSEIIRLTTIEGDVTCPGCAPDAPVVDADRLVVEALEGHPITDQVRMIFIGRVRAPSCGHYMAASERRAGLMFCERCQLAPGGDDQGAGGLVEPVEHVEPGGRAEMCDEGDGPHPIGSPGCVFAGDDDQDDDEQDAPRLTARFSRPSMTLSVGEQGAPGDDREWLEVGGEHDRDASLARAGYRRVADWPEIGDDGTSTVEVERLGQVEPVERARLARVYPGDDVEFALFGNPFPPAAGDDMTAMRVYLSARMRESDRAGLGDLDDAGIRHLVDQRDRTNYAAVIRVEHLESGELGQLTSPHDRTRVDDRAVYIEVTWHGGRRHDRYPARDFRVVEWFPNPGSWGWRSQRCVHTGCGQYAATISAGARPAGTTWQDERPRCRQHSSAIAVRTYAALHAASWCDQVPLERGEAYVAGEVIRMHHLQPGQIEALIAEMGDRVPSYMTLPSVMGDLTSEQLAEGARRLAESFREGTAPLDRDTMLAVLRRLAELLEQEDDGQSSAAAIRRLVELVEEGGDQDDAAAVAGAVDRQGDAVLTEVLQAAGEPVGEMATDVEVPGQRAGGGAVSVGRDGGGLAPWASGLVERVIETHRLALEALLRADGFRPDTLPGSDLPILRHPGGVSLWVDEGGTLIRYPASNIDDGEYGEGVGWVRLAFGANYGAIRDTLLGLVAVAGGTAPQVTASAAQVEAVLGLVARYGQACAVGGDTARGVESMAEAKRVAGERYGEVRVALLGLVGPPAGDVDPAHVTRILPRDAAGHWAWECDAPGDAHPAGDGDGSGYETAEEVLAAAIAHGPLAADSLQPVDEEDADPDAIEAHYLDAAGAREPSSMGPGSQLEIAGERYAVPDHVFGGIDSVQTRVVAALCTAGFVPASGGDYYKSTTRHGIMVVPAAWGSAVQDVRAQIEEALEAAGRHGLVLEEIRADLVEYQGDALERLPMALGELLTQMYAETVILATTLTETPDTRYYATGVDCSECESLGHNCLPHRTFQQRAGASW